MSEARTRHGEAEESREREEYEAAFQKYASAEYLYLLE